MSAPFDWYAYSVNLGEALVAAGLPEDLTDWKLLDEVESGGKHDCTDWSGFYEDPDAPGTGYFVQGSSSYNDGLQSLYIHDTRRQTRTLVEEVKLVPHYGVKE